MKEEIFIVIHITQFAISSNRYIIKKKQHEANKKSNHISNKRKVKTLENLKLFLFALRSVLLSLEIFAKNVVISG